MVVINEIHVAIITGEEMLSFFVKFALETYFENKMCFKLCRIYEYWNSPQRDHSHYGGYNKKER